MQTSAYGNCFTFNSNLSTGDNLAGERKSSMPGVNMGLVLSIDIEQQDYMKNGLTTKAGARVTIHSSNRRALTEEFGKDVPPATSTSFAIHEVVLIGETLN